jgi:hypothetical protein
VKPSAWEIVYSIAMALACLVSYAVMTEILNVAVEGHADLVGGMWAAVSTAFVFRDSRQHSLSAGARRLIATCVSFSARAKLHFSIAKSCTRFPDRAAGVLRRTRQ